MHLLARQVAEAELPVSLEHISITGWVHLIFKDHQPTGWLANIPASRQRRLNSHAIWRLLRGSIVADATVITFHAHRGLKPTAKFKAPLRGGERRANG